MIDARRDLVAAAVFCAAVGLYDAFYVWRLVTGGPLVRPGISAFFPDFLVFHAAGRAWGLPLVPLLLLLFGMVAWPRLPAPKGELRPVAAAR